MTIISRKIRVAVAVRRISFADGIGGMERAAADHLAGLLDHGFEVTLFAPIAGITGQPPELVDLVDVPWPEWFQGRAPLAAAYPTWVRRLARAIEASPAPPDVIHLHGGSVGVLRPGLLKSSTHIPAVANPHGMEEFAASTPLRTAGRLILRRLARQARHASKVVATDAVLEDAVRHNLGVTNDQVVTIPNAVNVDRLRAMVDPAGSSEHFAIVSVGRLVHNKGYDLLLAALRDSKVANTLPAGWTWTHFGTGPEADMLTSEARQGVRVPLTIRGGCSDGEVQTAVASAGLFVQPSRYEGSSLTTLEAMAHGAVVVGTAVGGIPDKIEDGRTGFLAPRATPEDLALAICRALGSTEAVGHRAARLIEQRFSSTSASAAYHSLYVALVSSDRSH